LYSTATVTPHQYVCSLSVAEEGLEKEVLHEPHGWQRNPVAAYKYHSDGRGSTLSLRLTHKDSTSAYGRTYAEPGMQLHWTIFPSERGGADIDLYAHYEDDWMASPLAHLRGDNMSSKEGVKRSLALLRRETSYEEGAVWWREPRFENI